MSCSVLPLQQCLGCPEAANSLYLQPCPGYPGPAPFRLNGGPLQVVEMLGKVEREKIQWKLMREAAELTLYSEP